MDFQFFYWITHRRYAFIFYILYIPLKRTVEGLFSNCIKSTIVETIINTLYMSGLAYLIWTILNE